MEPLPFDKICSDCKSKFKSKSVCKKLCPECSVRHTFETRERARLNQTSHKRKERAALKAPAVIATKKVIMTDDEQKRLNLLVDSKGCVPGLGRTIKPGTTEWYSVAVPLLKREKGLLCRVLIHKS